MFAFVLRRSTISLSLALVAVVAGGCGEAPVRENRTIEFSRDGGQVAFQHEGEGVFVASADGKGLTKIFQPDEDVLATSRPLASPTDGRIIFTTAQPLAGDRPGPRPIGPTPAEGRTHFQQPVNFTCWLRDVEKPDQPAVVKKLFTARCEHIGYVTAGLAVRWHTDGKHILYLGAVAENSPEHTLFEFDLATGNSRRVFEHAGRALVFDWTPRGTHLVCSLSNLSNRESVPPPQEPARHPDATSGTWIGQPGDDKSWWRVPGSERLAEGELPSVIEMLRASRPAWTQDEAQFAFVSRQPVKNDPQQHTHHLQLVEFASRKITTLAESAGPFVDLHWSPDGQRLGFLQQDANKPAALRIWGPEGQISDRPVTEPLRKFAGFDSTGTRLAYVTACQPILPPEPHPWALLLLRDAQARDSVRIAPAMGDEAATEVLSGIRVTFPQWSPKDERLSVWLTFTPEYRSLLSLFMRWGLWPGDPAATIDATTHTIAWMPVTPQEELQIGHYYLMKRDYQESARWYKRARGKMPPTKPPADLTEFARQIGSPENSLLFEAICLQHLGQAEKAAAKLKEFEQNFFPAPPPPPKPGEAPAPATDMFGLFGQDTVLLKSLIHDFYVAEVFLSIDAGTEGLEYFHRPPAMPDSDSQAFSRAVVVSQLLLIARDYDGYLAHCTDVLAPVAMRIASAKPAGQGPETQMLQQFAAGMSLAPLFREDFIKLLSHDALEHSLPTWKDYADKKPADSSAVAIDLVLRAAARAAGDQAEAQAADQRIANNPHGQQLFSGRPVDEVVTGWFDFAGNMGIRL